MGDGLRVTGGAGGVAADIADLRTRAQVADDLASHVGEVAREVGQLTLRSDVAATVPLSPSTAARAQVEAVEAAARLGRRLVELQARAARLRLLADATETADGLVTFGGDTARTVRGLDAIGDGLGSWLGLYGDHFGDATRDAARTGFEEGWDAFTDAMRAAPGEAWRSSQPEAIDLWSELLLERPEVVDGVVSTVVAGVHVADRLGHGPGATYRDVVIRLTALAESRGFGDPDITVGPGVRTDHAAGGDARVPSSLADLVDNQITLMNAARADTDASRLRIIEVPSATGSSWVVQVPGTQALDGGSNPSDMRTNLSLSGLQEAALLDAIATTLDAHGVGDDPVLVAGHSQGGIAAVNFAAQAAERGFNVTHAFAIGSPIATIDVPPEVQVLALEHHNDAVPRLDATANRDRPNVTTVTVDVGTEHDDPFGPHGSDLYRETAEVVDRSPDPSVTTFLEGLSPFLDGSATSGARAHDHAIRRDP